jgi:hypothetical protein
MFSECDVFLECDVNVLLMDLKHLRRVLGIESGIYSLGRHTAWELCAAACKIDSLAVSFLFSPYIKRSKIGSNSGSSDEIESSTTEGAPRHKLEQSGIF